MLFLSCLLAVEMGKSDINMSSMLVKQASAWEANFF